jgi:hypothetical protein
LQERLLPHKPGGKTRIPFAYTLEVYHETFGNARSVRHERSSGRRQEAGRRQHHRVAGRHDLRLRKPGPSTERGVCTPPFSIKIKQASCDARFFV